MTLPGSARQVIADQMRQRIVRAEERMFFGVATRSSLVESEPLTVDRLAGLLAAMPPRETWVVSKLWPPKGALIVRAPDETFTLINDHTWPQVRRAWLAALPEETRHNPLNTPSPVFIDADPLDPPEHADWREKERKRVVDSIVGVISAHAQLKAVLTSWWRRIGYDHTA